MNQLWNTEKFLTISNFNRIFFLFENDLVIEKELRKGRFGTPKFETYFPSSKYHEFSWVPDPFHCDVEINKLPLKEREQLVEFSNDTGLEMKLHEESLVSFWMSTENVQSLK